MLRIDRSEFAFGAARIKRRRVKELGEPVECRLERVGRDVEAGLRSAKHSSGQPIDTKRTISRKSDALVVCVVHAWSTDEIGTVSKASSARTVETRSWDAPVKAFELPPLAERNCKAYSKRCR